MCGVNGESVFLGGGGFYMTRGGRGGEGAQRGGRNFKSCLQISLRTRKAPGEHL